MILDCDLMNELGIILDFKNKTITWDNLRIKRRTYPSESKKQKMQQSTLSRLLAVALRMHQTLTYCCLHNPHEYQLQVE